MVEQGLKAVVYPELDDYGMSEFIKEFQKQMSGYVSVGVNIPDNATNVQPTESRPQPTPEPTNTQPTNPNEGETIVQDVKKGINESEVGQNVQEEQRKENGEKSYKEQLKESIGSIIGKIADATGISKLQQSESGQKMGEILGKAGAIGSAIGVGAVSVAEYVGKIFNFLMNASPALRQVFDIIGQLVQLIWMPIGTILAVELMPMIADIAQDIGEWMGEAWEIYDKEGWTGLIKKAVEMTFTVLADMLGFILPPIFTALGEMIWDGLNNAWTDFTNWLGQAFTDFVGWLWEGFTSTPIGMGIEFLINTIPSVFDTLVGWYEELDSIFGGMINNILGGFQDFLENPLETLISLPSKIIDIPRMILQGLRDLFGETFYPVFDLIEGIYNFLVGPIETVTDFVSDLANDPIGTISGSVGAFVNDPVGTTVNTIKSVIPFFAEGGIVTEPTLGIVGESGPEAIVPLEQMGNAGNQYSYNSRLDSLNNDYKINTQNITGGNTMNFYITGNNATEIGGEVQRILEKTVGKASSKMMWW